MYIYKKLITKRFKAMENLIIQIDGSDECTVSLFLEVNEDFTEEEINGLKSLEIGDTILLGLSEIKRVK